MVLSGDTQRGAINLDVCDGREGQFAVVRDKPDEFYENLAKELGVSKAKELLINLDQGEVFKFDDTVYVPMKGGRRYNIDLKEDKSFFPGISESFRYRNRHINVIYAPFKEGLTLNHKCL